MEYVTRITDGIRQFFSGIFHGRGIAANDMWLWIVLIFAIVAFVLVMVLISRSRTGRGSVAGNDSAGSSPAAISDEEPAAEPPSGDSGRQPDTGRPPARQATSIMDYFPHPAMGNPAAVLVGVGGTVNGQRFFIEKENFRIGRNFDNDLCITGDDFVSGSHARLQYESGGLFLFDQDSRNGTFLNGKKVTGAAVTIRFGDSIRIGSSIFRVAETRSPTGPGAADKKERPVL